jgi:hypothetical protein
MQLQLFVRLPTGTTTTPNQINIIISLKEILGAFIITQFRCEWKGLWQTYLMVRIGYYTQKTEPIMNILIFADSFSRTA